jgi:hypothetical protein
MARSDFIYKRNNTYIRFLHIRRWLRRTQSYGLGHAHRTSGDACHADALTRRHHLGSVSASQVSPGASDEVRVRTGPAWLTHTTWHPQGASCPVMHTLNTRDDLGGARTLLIVRPAMRLHDHTGMTQIVLRPHRHPPRARLVPCLAAQPPVALLPLDEGLDAAASCRTASRQDEWPLRPSSRRYHCAAGLQCPMPGLVMLSSPVSTPPFSPRLATHH